MSDDFDFVLLAYLKHFGEDAERPCKESSEVKVTDGIRATTLRNEDGGFLASHAMIDGVEWWSYAANTQPVVDLIDFHDIA